MKKSITAYIFLGITALSSLFVKISRADDTSSPPVIDSKGLGSAFGDIILKAGQKAGYKTGQEALLSNIISRGISLILGFLGVLFLILIIYHGIHWMMAGGSNEKVNNSKEGIKQAIIGLAVVLAAYAISTYLFHLWHITNPLSG